MAAPATSLIEEIHELLASLDEFAGVSGDGIRVDPLQTLPHSEVYRIRITSAATSLILKRPGVSDVSGLAERERRFYRHIAPLLPDGLVPACFLAADDDKGSWLLIEDLSDTHREIGDPSRPTLEQCQGLATALATLHGFTGAHSTIREEWIKVSADLPTARIDQRLDVFLMALEPFIDMHRDRMDRRIVDLLSGLEDTPALLAQAASRQPVLVHGDAHFGNVLYSPASSACLIDWGMPMVAFGGIDLAHALALNLPRQFAREWESEVVRAYLEQTSACGSHLDADEFYECYRLGVLYSLGSPIVWSYSGVPESVWWPALANAVAAADDLELLS